MRLRVRASLIQALVDNIEVLHLPPAGHTLSIREQESPDIGPLGIANWQTGSALRDIQYRRLTPAERAAPPTIASQATPSTSCCNRTDTVLALNDQIVPKDSADDSIPRLTWWDHCGSQEWVQYDLDRPRKVSGIEVYWWDETRTGRKCRVPKSWRLLYKTGNDWNVATDVAEYGVKRDQFNVVKFGPVVTTALRIELVLQADWCGGILEWRVTE